MNDPKGTHGMDWQAFSAIMQLSALAIVFLSGITGVLYILAHFILKYW